MAPLPERPAAHSGRGTTTPGPSTMSVADFDSDLIQIQLPAGGAGGPAGLAVVAKATAGALVELSIFRSFDLAAARVDMPSAGQLHPDRPPLPQVRRQPAEYFPGDRRDLVLPLAPHGPVFERGVSPALATIPHSQSRSLPRAAIPIPP